MTANGTEIVERVVQALQADDGEAALKEIDPEVEVHDFDLPDAGIYRGHEGVLAWLADWGEPWDDYGWDGHRYVQAQDKVVHTFELWARTGELETKRRNAIVWTVRGEKITRLEYYTAQDEAREAAGIPSSSS
jgi:ketosteroid isomerase-like protein